MNYLGDHAYVYGEAQPMCPGGVCPINLPPDSEPVAIPVWSIAMVVGGFALLLGLGYLYSKKKI